MKYNALLDIHDPLVDAENALDEYNINMLAEPKPDMYDAVIVAVAHDQFRDRGAAGKRALCKADGILYDIKYLLPVAEVDGRL